MLHWHACGGYWGGSADLGGVDVKPLDVVGKPADRHDVPVARTQSADALPEFSNRAPQSGDLSRRHAAPPCRRPWLLNQGASGSASTYDADFAPPDHAVTSTTHVSCITIAD
jgi:hypothetical protein